LGSWNLVVLLTPESITGSVLIVVVAALLGEGGYHLIRRVGKRAGLKDLALATIRDVTRVIWIVLAIFGVAFELNLASDLTVLAASTIGGLILSLALQATLSNVIAGLFMLEDGTLRVGDEVTFSGVKGKVVRITLRTTWIASEKGPIAVVSNSNLMGGPLIVHSATTRLVKRHGLETVIPPAPPPAVPPIQGPEPAPEKGSEASGAEEQPKKPIRKRPEKDAGESGS
jgi:small-conductance mechanosensitive channel